MPLLLIPRLYLVSDIGGGGRRAASGGSGDGDLRKPRPKLDPILASTPRESNFEAVRALTKEQQKPDVVQVTPTPPPAKPSEPEAPPSPTTPTALDKAAQLFNLSRLKRSQPLPKIKGKPEPTQIVESPPVTTEPPVVPAPDVAPLIAEVDVMLLQHKQIEEEERELMLLLSLLEDDDDLLFDQ